jgi:glucose-1-phosphate cytidylyltransferase
VKAVILCGGKGTRLREETEYRPKPMVEVGGRPILWHIMKTYAHHGITDFVLCTGYKGEMIKEYFLNYEALNNDFTITLGRKHEMEFHDAHLESNWKVTLADTGLETQTAGRLAKIERYVADDEQFCVTYGDGVANVNIAETIKFHNSHGRAATVTSVQIPSRFGVLSVDQETGAVPHFEEKAAVDGWVNGGFFVFNRDVFRYFDEDVMLEQEPLQHMTKDGQLMAWRHYGFWQPMDTFRESSMLNAMWDAGEAPWKVWDDQADSSERGAS